MNERTEQSNLLDPGISYTLEEFKNWDWSILENMPYTNGKYFLEVGAGQSSVCAGLREKGIVAFAIDPAYSEPKEHDQKVNEWLNSKILPDNERYNELQQARSVFKQDRDKNPGYYIPAISTHLPFRTNSMDLILSSHCIGTVLAIEYEQLEKSMSEVIRVLKPSGCAIIYPYDHFEFISTHQIQNAKDLESNQQKFQKRLRRSGHPFKVFTERHPNPLDPALKVRKALLLRKSPYGKHL